MLRRVDQPTNVGEDPYEARTDAQEITTALYVVDNWRWQGTMGTPSAQQARERIDPVGTRSTRP